MRLPRPRHVGRSNQHERKSALLSMLHELVYSPIFKHEAEHEHDEAERAEDEHGVDVVLAEAFGQPSEE